MSAKYKITSVVKNMTKDLDYNPNFEAIKTKNPSYSIRPKTTNPEIRSRRNKDTTTKNGKVKVKNQVDHDMNDIKVNQVKFKTYSFTFGLKSSTKDKKVTVSPSRYKIKSELEWSTNPKININPIKQNKSRIEINRLTPGPTKYDIKSINDGPKFSMSFHKPKFNLTGTKLGPGQYEPVFKQTLLAFPKIR